MIYVLFGPPGVGKTYVGELVSKSLGIKFLDADSLYEAEEVRLLQEGAYNQTDRDHFFKKLMDKIGSIVDKDNKNLIVAAAFTKEKNRLEFVDHFSNQICYIRVDTPREVAIKRARERLKKSTHTINEIALELIWREFDAPRFLHMQLVNDGLTDKELVFEFTRLIQLIEN